jgi:hypothetical protein
MRQLLLKRQRTYSNFRTGATFALKETEEDLIPTHIRNATGTTISSRMTWIRGGTEENFALKLGLI